jgi:hypothetical protein
MFSLFTMSKRRQVDDVRLDEQTLKQVLADLIDWGMVEPNGIEPLTS